MKLGSIICLSLFSIGAFISIIQLWLTPLDGEVFIKTLMTLGILFVVSLGITLVKREYFEDKEMKKNGYID